MAVPGSALWLLRHELRMLLIRTFATRADPARLGTKKKVIVVWTLLGVGAHCAAYFLLRTLGGPSALPAHALVMGVSLVMLGALSMMLSGGLKESVEALFERGDLDLLLSSPLSSRSIFITRLAAISISLASIYLFFLAPFAHAGLLLGQFHWLGVYPAIISMALCAASASMLLTLGLVRWLGVRRTRVFAQILGALTGAALFLLSQASNRAFGDAAGKVLSRLKSFATDIGPDNLLWLPAKAALGSAQASLLLLAAGALAFWVTVSLTHRFFVHGVQQAASQVRVASRPAGAPRFQFGRGLLHVLLLKEWRLILRDPQLISQVLLQLLYMVPLCAMLLAGGRNSLTSAGTALTFLCASLTSSLGWIIISAEDAPDLLRAAPCPPATVQRAKLAAVTLPVLLLILAPVGWALLRSPAAGSVLALAAMAATASAALIVLWCGRPGVRGDFKRRAKGNAFSNTMELLSSAGWALTAYLLLSALESGAWRAAKLGAAAGVGLAVAGVLLLARSRRQKAL